MLLANMFVVATRIHRQPATELWWSARTRQQWCNWLARRAMEETSYVAESEPMSLARFADRYRPSPRSPQAAVVCSSGLHSSEQQLLAEGTEWRIESTIYAIYHRACMLPLTTSRCMYGIIVRGPVAAFVSVRVNIFFVCSSFSLFVDLNLYYNCLGKHLV